MKIGILNETTEVEKRVAITPQAALLLAKLKIEWLIEKGAGEKAGFADASYRDQNMSVLNSQQEVLNSAEIILHIASPTFDKIAAYTKSAQRPLISIGMADALWDRDRFKKAGAPLLTAYSLDLMPRISRAQSMDVLSSMSTVAGYKAVLLATESLNKVIPMLTTAAGSIPPAKILVIGSGVAGLQAMATAKRLGAVVFGYDVRLATVDQIQSVGAKPVLNAEVLTENNRERQNTLLAAAASEADVVITTALIPGGKAPLIITREMVKNMKAGTVIVDLAAERGGNCELTVAGKNTLEYGVIIVGPVNLASSIPYQTSMMFTKNVGAFLKLVVKDGQFKPDFTDEIVKTTLISPAVVEETKELAHAA